MNFSKETLFRHFDIRNAEIAENAFYKMTTGEKSVFFLFIFLLILSVSLMLGKINSYIVIEKPIAGGSLEEGVIGFPRFVNPLLASSDADRDLTALVYSGLMKATPDGDFIYDLAESYEISDDGLEYIFTIKNDVYFHDGAPVTADDIIFTVNKSKDSVIKSPKRANWEGVIVEKINDKQVRFILKEAYSPFIENTTLGILPNHIWSNIDSEQFAFSSFNTTPIGSGPYEVDDVKRNSSGIPDTYILKNYNDYALGAPFITKISLNFFSNEEALINAFKSGKVSSINSISSEVAKELTISGYRVEQYPLPRIFGVFLNQNQAPIFTDIQVRKALSIAIDREDIVNKVLAGYGTPITGPIPGSVLNTNIAISDKNNTSTSTTSFRVIEARKILEANGWTMNEELGVRTKKVGKVVQELRFTLATSNAPELKKVAELIKTTWESVGARVSLELYEIGNLNQEVIRPRKYDAILFGEIVGRDLDLFAFWHSSQRNDPGLNIAMYANIKADALLEKIRTTADESERQESFSAFNNEIQKDVAAIFIYSPDFIYAMPKNVKGFSAGTITTPAERFLGIHTWYINSRKVWNL